MISLKYAILMGVAAFAAGSFFAPPVQQAIAAVIATDVQCAGCVGTSDLAGNAVTAVKVKDGEIKAAEIATDAVGAAELQGVTKLLFGQCKPDPATASSSYTPGNGPTVICNITGVDGDDSASATLNDTDPCFAIRGAYPGSNKVDVITVNQCTSNASLTTFSEIAVMVYDK
jgi:hypothetical protein